MINSLLNLDLTVYDHLVYALVTVPESYGLHLFLLVGGEVLPVLVPPLVVLRLRLRPLVLHDLLDLQRLHLDRKPLYEVLNENG